MSKTNHRVNKDRGEKLSEASSHKNRREFKQKATDIVELYDPEYIDEIIDEYDWERYEKTGVKHGKTR